MVINTVCRSFQHLNLTAARIFTARYSTACYQNVSKRKIPPMDIQPSIFEPNFKFAAVSSPNIDLGLPRIGIIKPIIENPHNIIADIIEPTKIRQQIEDRVPEKSVDLPTIGNIIDKHAHRMIRIRRRKVRRHKLRKKRKRLRHYRRKMRLRREIIREKSFHAELLAQLHEAKNFDPKAYVQSRLDILYQVRMPTRWKGARLPESTIRQFMREQEEFERRRTPPPIKL